MKFIHNITITVFIEQEEDEKLIAEQIAQFLPENFVEEKLSMEIEKAQIEEGRNINILTVNIQKERHTKVVLHTLKEFLGTKQCQTIAMQANRVDEKGKLFIRIDKQAFVDEGKAVLVDHGKCIHFSLMMAAYPKTRAKAIEIVKELFEQ